MTNDYNSKGELEKELKWVDFDIKALDTYYRFGATPLCGGAGGGIAGTLVGLIGGTIASLVTGDYSNLRYGAEIGFGVGAVGGMIAFPIWRGSSMKNALEKRRDLVARLYECNE